MTARYVAIAKPPRSWVLDEAWAQPWRPTITVEEDDPGPKDTGLLDANGTRLYRVTDTVPMGFGR